MPQALGKQRPVHEGVVGPEAVRSAGAAVFENSPSYTSTSGNPNPAPVPRIGPGRPRRILPPKPPAGFLGMRRRLPSSESRSGSRSAQGIPGAAARCSAGSGSQWSRFASRRRESVGNVCTGPRRRRSLRVPRTAPAHAAVLCPLRSPPVPERASHHPEAHWAAEPAPSRITGEGQPSVLLPRIHVLIPSVCSQRNSVSRVGTMAKPRADAAVAGRRSGVGTGEAEGSTPTSRTRAKSRSSSASSSTQSAGTDTSGPLAYRMEMPTTAVTACSNAIRSLRRTPGAALHRLANPRCTAARNEGSASPTIDTLANTSDNVRPL